MSILKSVRVIAALSLLSIQPSLAFAQNLQFDANVSPELKSQVMSDFEFLGSISGLKASPIHQSIFGAVQGANYLNWFNARVFHFGVDVCGGAGSVACQDANYPHQIFVTNHYIQDGYPQVARLMTIFHEARHTEDKNGNWPHATCPAFFKPKSIWTGQSLSLHAACDHTELGSYGSASILLNNIARFCTNCNSKITSDANLYANDQIKRITDSAARARIDADFKQETK